MKIELEYGDSIIDIDIPKNNLLDVLKPMDVEGVNNPNLEAQEALRNPISSCRLKTLVKNKGNIVILASDITRPSPSQILIPPILEELEKGGIKDKEITIIFGLGYHRKHTEEEKKILVGEKIYNKILCIDHDIDNCVHVGDTSRGTPVEVFKPVAEADFIIATGNLEFHYKAGYSGGNKALLPGVCSKKTIETNHIMMIKPGTMPGKTEDNPMREDIEEGGRIADVGFIVNAVLNSNKEIVKVVAGNPISAHREGVKYIDKMYKRIIEEKTDIVIASCGGYPKDINLYQAQKGLENASFAVKDGGSIILIAECREGLGEKTFEEWMFKAKDSSEPIKWIKEKFILGAHKAAVICMVLERANVYLVSSIEDDIVREIFMNPINSAQRALEKAFQEHGDEAKVLVLPSANSTLPFVAGQ